MRWPPHHTALKGRRSRQTLVPEGSCDGGEAGVTLVELLVVLGLMALIGIFMAGGLSAMKAVLPFSSAMAASDEIALARDHLRNTLSETVAQSLLRQELYFEGDRNSIGFVAASDPILEPPGLIRIHLGVELVDGRPALVERRRLDREDSEPNESVTVLIKGIAALDLDYVRNGRSVSAVARGTAPPERVLLRITFPEGDRRHFIPLEVALICAPKEMQGT